MLSIDARSCGIYGCRVLCAVSGGADSVALLRLLAQCRDKGDVTLYAAHFEHGIRGAASLQDMEFVKSLCRELNVPLKIGRGNVPGVCQFTHEGLESCARRLRHEFLESTRDKLGCDCIALAHHRRDRAETVLMHLLRGGGLQGAAAMPMRAGRIVRPLIGNSPDEIVDYLVLNDYSWREDATNTVDDNPRNALRLNVFPRLKHIYPGFEQALCRFSEISLAEDALLEKLTNAYWQENVRRFAGVWVIKRGETALLRRCLKRLLPESDFETIERAIAAQKNTDIGNGLSASGDGEHLYLTPPLTKPREQKLSLEGVTVLSGVCEISAESCPPVPILDNGYTQVLRRDALEGAVVRLWQEGDSIAPLGLKGGRKTLGDYFTDRRVPSALRGRLPIVASGSEALWLPGLGISDKLRVSGDVPAVKLTIKIAGGDNDAK